MCYKQKLLEFVLSLYENQLKYNSRKVMPNIKQALIHCYENLREMDP
jgi:nitrate/nitrite-specific signal transduction histidine kinase